MFLNNVANVKYLQNLPDGSKKTIEEYSNNIQTNLLPRPLTRSTIIYNNYNRRNNHSSLNNWILLLLTRYIN